NRSTELDLAGLPDLAHAAVADLAEQLVAMIEQRVGGLSLQRLPGDGGVVVVVVVGQARARDGWIVVSARDPLMDAGLLRDRRIVGRCVGTGAVGGPLHERIDQWTTIERGSSSPPAGQRGTSVQITRWASPA